MRWLVVIGILMAAPAAACPRFYFVAIETEDDLEHAPSRLPTFPTLWLANGVRLFDENGDAVRTWRLDDHRVVVPMASGRITARGWLHGYPREEAYVIGALPPRERGPGGLVASLALLALAVGVARRQAPG